MRKTVLITGGSSGIGYELSRHFARAAYQLLWVAQPPRELEQAKQRLLAEFPQVHLQTLAKDLSQATAAKEVQLWAEPFGPVDVLINNAGFGTYGFTTETDMEEELAMIRLNVINVYTLTRLFLAKMVARNAGTIINVSSIAAFQPTTRFNTYASTKAFVLHFTQGLQEELGLQKSKVQVMAVCPAAIRDTAFQARAKMEGVRTFDGLATTTAAEVAKDIWQGFRKENRLVVSG
ncbi:MAG: SDR family NAD(P)-dependent oxidoreductase, partial [Bacteroidota bacterium]